jgi:hypothetical protein
LIEVDDGTLVYRFRWPWRVVETPGGGFKASLPWWGRPYRGLLLLLGIQLVTVHRSRNFPSCCEGAD